ncbi:MAG: DUF1611 domain-containing protein [Pseudomonadales bacterium]
MIEIRPPYALFLGDVTNPLDAKTAYGLAQWRANDCLGQIRLPSCKVDLGIEDLSLSDAKARGVRSIIIGVAPTGGQLPIEWQAELLQAVNMGFDIASGLHQRLHELAEFTKAAELNNTQLIDVRDAPKCYTVASGKKRSGKRVLTVGTDCCVGKKYTALALHKALANRGAKATFRASGQTGILISGAGIPIDAIVSDFISGAAEALSPDNSEDHWDVIEGQGSLYHPGYAAVTLGLLHGSQADALVLCHEYGREAIDEYPDYPIPNIEEYLQHYLSLARLTNKNAKWAGISLNTAALSSEERLKVISDYEDRYQLPCIDPLVSDLSKITSRLS